MPTITNRILWGNSAAGGGNSIYNAGTSTPYISYSDVQGCGGSGGGWVGGLGIDGGNNIDADPLFTDADGTDNIVGTVDDDLSLLTGSPCIGAGVADENMGINYPVDAIPQAQTTLTDPVDLVLNSQGNIYVLSSSQSKVYVYNDELVQQGSSITLTSTNPKGLDVDESDNIYLADTGGHCVRKFLSNGTADTSFGTNGVIGQYGTGDGEFDQPWAVGIDGNGKLYVTDSGNNRVQIFDSSTGEFIDTWGEAGSAEGKLADPAGFCLVNGSELGLADSGNNRVQSFYLTSGYCHHRIGELGAQLAQFSVPRDVCYDNDRDQIIVADTGNNRLQIFQLYNIGQFGLSQPTFVKEIADVGLLSPSGVAYDPGETDQIIYVADTGNNKVIKLKVKTDIPGVTPLHTFEAFKAALRTDDLDRALACFADRERYTGILNLLRPKFGDMVDDMEGMVPDYVGFNTAAYDLLRQEGPVIYGYPVFFIRLPEGWKISDF